MGDIFMKQKKQNRKAKKIGSEVNILIWDQLKIQAIKEGRKTGEVLDDAIKMYLENKKGSFLKLGLGYPFD
jgi:hypothetical protein